MVSTINDNPFSLEAMYQPYDFFARLREWEPVHYNEEYEVWMVTDWEHLVWVTRHPRGFLLQRLRPRRSPPEPAHRRRRHGNLQLHQELAGFPASSSTTRNATTPKYPAPTTWICAG